MAPSGRVSGVGIVEVGSRSSISSVVSVVPLELVVEPRVVVVLDPVVVEVVADEEVVDPCEVEVLGREVVVLGGRDVVVVEGSRVVLVVTIWAPAGAVPLPGIPMSTMLRRAPTAHLLIEQTFDTFGPWDGATLRSPGRSSSAGCREDPTTVPMAPMGETVRPGPIAANPTRLQPI